MIHFGLGPTVPAIQTYSKPIRPIQQSLPIHFGMADTVKIRRFSTENYTTTRGITVTLQLSPQIEDDEQFIWAVKAALDEVPPFILYLAVQSGYRFHLVRRQRPSELPKNIHNFIPTAYGQCYTDPNQKLIVIPYQWLTQNKSYKSYDDCSLYELVDTLIHECLHAIDTEYGDLFTLSTTSKDPFSKNLKGHSNMKTACPLAELILHPLFQKAYQEDKNALSAEAYKELCDWLDDEISETEMWAYIGAAILLPQYMAGKQTGFGALVLKHFPKTTKVMRKDFLPLLKQKYKSDLKNQR